MGKSVTTLFTRAPEGHFDTRVLSFVASCWLHAPGACVSLS